MSIVLLKSRGYSKLYPHQFLTMTKFLVRDDYYQMILELLELERISVGDYLDHKSKLLQNENPHFVEILYKDINTVLHDVLGPEEGDEVIENGDLVMEYGDLKLSGPVNNLHFALIWLHQAKVEKTLCDIKSPQQFIDKMERFENDFLSVNYNTPEYDQKLKALNSRIKGWQSPVSINTERKNKTRKKIPKESKVRAELQKEINSRCPFCSSTEVGHFEIHHIDEDPAHNESYNLLLLCPTCHSKITKGDITEQQVRQIKMSLSSNGSLIEFVSAIIDQDNCSWHSRGEHRFYKSDSDKSPFPVISFTLINHSEKTIVLKTIQLSVKNLPSGIGGIPQAAILKSTVKYHLCINEDPDQNTYNLSEPIQIPAGQAVKFDVELFEKITDHITPPQGRKVLYFLLKFSSNHCENIPPIFLNCQSEDEPLKICREVG